MARQLMAEITRAHQRLDAHEERISATERELREVNRDIGVLGEIVLRSKARARRLLRRSKAATRTRGQ